MTARECEIIGLIHKEVKPALGCTEPVAVALATAKATELMNGKIPDFDRKGIGFKINVGVSGNILKNGMGVGIPGTGMIGLRIAAALGAVCGASEYGLEVLKDLNDEAVVLAKRLVAENRVNICIVNNCPKLYVKCDILADGHTSFCVIEDVHDRIVETGVDTEMHHFSRTFRRKYYGYISVFPRNIL